LGETVWQQAARPEITLRDARVAEELVNDELDRRFFRDRYEKATEAERIYMAAMADLRSRCSICVARRGRRLALGSKDEPRSDPSQI